MFGYNIFHGSSLCFSKLVMFKVWFGKGMYSMFYIFYNLSTLKNVALNMFTVQLGFNLSNGDSGFFLPQPG